MNLAVIIPAAGFSSRFNAGDSELERGGIGPRNKLDEDLGGRPVLHRTIELFAKRHEVQTIIVAGPHDDAAFAEFSLRHADRVSMLGGQLVRGGVTHRYETVAAALEKVPDDATHIAVHDAARPNCTGELLDRVLAAAASHPAVVPALPMTDTIKRTGEAVEAGAADPLAAILGGGSETTGGSAKRIVETLDRTDLVLVQTPQVFERELLLRAYQQNDLTSTDDASLVERLGEPVIVVEGDPANLKLTTPSEVPVLRALMGFKPPAERATHKKF